MKFLIGALLGTCLATSAFAEDINVKIGLLTDLTTSVSDLTGPGGEVATRMAIEDFDGAKRGIKVDLVVADHQMKPDIALGIARRWFDEENVDAISDLSGSAIALGVVDLATQRDKVTLNTSGGVATLSGEKCSPTSVQWAYDTWSQANSVGTAVAKDGGDSWFFISADYAFGHALEADMSKAVEAAGGKVLGKVRVPLGTADYSSFLLQAQASGAKVIGLNTVAGDLITAIKQANEFGLVAAGQRIATPIIFSSDIHSVGLDTAKGLLLAAPFYPELNDNTRAWSKRFSERFDGKAPTFLQASLYSVTLAYLRAVEAAKTTDTKAVMAKLHEMETDDPIFGKGKVLANGRHAHAVYLLQVKSPDEAANEWDMFKLVGTIPAEQAVKPLAETGCPLVM